MLKGGGKKHQITTKNGKSIYSQAVTMIDPASCLIEIHTIPSDRADLISNIVELVYLTQYPLPSKVKIDQRNEFLAEFKTMIQADYGIEVKPISSRKTQANSILEGFIKL